jgi:hypothetical protein
MSGFSSKIVRFDDPWDVGKTYFIEEAYQFHYHSTSDVIEFTREGKSL